ncbi:hypothetical protein CAL21_10865 [Bordetella genomosp. 4]|nr:hypothetical protein CAL21_10865 [Bordetella genomosp. 4]
MDQNNDRTRDSDQFGLSADELAAFAEAAGIEDIEPTALMAFALSIAEECAEIGDRYSLNGGNCGDEIRARFGLG